MSDLRRRDAWDVHNGAHSPHLHRGRLPDVHGGVHFPAADDGVADRVLAAVLLRRGLLVRVHRLLRGVPRRSEPRCGRSSGGGHRRWPASRRGGLLAAAHQDGWSGLGVEVSEWAAEKARKQHALTVVADLADVPDGKELGLITIFHVVEHLPDPVPALVAARRLLAPDGLLVVEVPHWRSLGRLVRRESWSQLRPPEHINFLTRGSLTTLLGHAGLVPTQVDTPYPHLHDRWRAARGAARVRAGAGLAGAIVAERLQVGGYLRVVARPG